MMMHHVEIVPTRKLETAQLSIEQYEKIMRNPGYAVCEMYDNRIVRLFVAPDRVQANALSVAVRRVYLEA